MHMKFHIKVLILHTGTNNNLYVYFKLYQDYNNITVESRIICFRHHWHSFHHRIRNVDET